MVIWGQGEGNRRSAQDRPGNFVQRSSSQIQGNGPMVKNKEVKMPTTKFQLEHAVIDD